MNGSYFFYKMPEMLKNPKGRTARQACILEILAGIIDQQKRLTELHKQAEGRIDDIYDRFSELEHELDIDLDVLELMDPEDHTTKEV